MRIATYNIWNHDKESDNRFEQITDTIRTIHADILCLQEVRDRAYHEALLARTQYPYATFANHDNEEEGLSIFSLHPILNSEYITSSLLSTVKFKDNYVLIANLHLSWQSALQREHEIIKIANILSQKTGDYKLILGDFNCSPYSNVQQYLLGQSSLLGYESNPCYYDLAESYADITDSLPENTLDFRKNPRWNGKNTIEINQRYDRIFLQNPYPHDFPKLINYKVFGKEISPTTHLAPSDHYGVYVDLDFI